MSSSEDLGKPGAGADLSAGLYTAPLLLAARNCSSLKRLLDFGEEVGSKEEVVRMVVEAGGVDEAVELAQAHANTALGAVEEWEGEQVEELKDFVGQVIGQVEARYDQLFRSARASCTTSGGPRGGRCLLFLNDAMFSNS